MTVEDIKTWWKKRERANALAQAQRAFNRHDSLDLMGYVGFAVIVAAWILFLHCF